MSTPDPKAGAQAELAEVDRIRALGSTKVLNSDSETLDVVRPPLMTLVSALTAAGTDAGRIKSATDTFLAWKNTDKGWAHWEKYKAAKITYAKPPDPVTKAPTTPTWSDTCNTVWADMNARYWNWNGGYAARGQWWNGPATGGPDGSRRVPDSVVQELKKRVNVEKPGGTESWWVFSDSWSGDLSFHRTYQGIAFIYHMR